MADYEHHCGCEECSARSAARVVMAMGVLVYYPLRANVIENKVLSDVLKRCGAFSNSKHDDKDRYHYGAPARTLLSFK